MVLSSGLDDTVTVAKQGVWQTLDESRDIFGNFTGILMTCSDR